jgi:hypothetical protein
MENRNIQRQDMEGLHSDGARQWKMYNITENKYNTVLSCGIKNLSMQSVIGYRNLLNTYLVVCCAVPDVSVCSEPKR